jgi:hypothetical protein
VSASDGTRGAYRALSDVPRKGIDFAEMRSTKGWWAFGLASIGVLWTLALFPAAFFFPAYHGEAGTSSGATTQTTDTLVGVNGAWVVALFVPPAVLAVTAWLGLHKRCTTGSRRGRQVGRVAAGLLVASAILSFSLGIFVLPAALLVGAAALLTPSGRQAAET